MPTFARESKATHAAARKSRVVSAPILGRSGETSQSLDLDRNTGNQARLRLLMADAASARRASTIAAVSRLGHSSRRIQAGPQSSGVASEPRKASRTLTFKAGPPSTGSEKTIAPLGAGPNEELTVPPDAGSAAPAPTAPAPTAPAPTAPAPTPAAPSFCKVTPTSASIKNVAKTHNGNSYGHEFDFSVGLSYTKLDASATQNQDATFEWWEKTSRPPAWQTVIRANTWNDMFALYPSSPTFEGWTRNRTKPCPGTETAAVHDTPNADVTLPARTLEFNLKVTGGGATKSATGKQVLEPDGSGGIRTQTFT